MSIRNSKNLKAPHYAEGLLDYHDMRPKYYAHDFVWTASNAKEYRKKLKTPFSNLSKDSIVKCVITFQIPKNIYSPKRAKRTRTTTAPRQAERAAVVVGTQRIQA